MKLCYYKILLFSISLSIFVSSSYAHNKNKPYIIPRYTPNATSRGLSECDIQTSIYDDTHMKFVKENFHRQTSQRFEEYNERMNKNRQKCKEQCDKDIQQIISNDKIQKSLAEKVEKGCLKCGCGLGGVAASVGIIGPIAVNEWTKAATAAAVQKGIKAGIAKAIDDLGNIVGLIQFDLIDWAAKIDGINFLKQNSLVSIVNEVYYKCIDIENSSDFLFCSATKAWDKQNSILALQTISTQAAEAAVAAGKAAETAETAEKAEIVLVNAKSSLLYSAIGYSVMAILIILLVMVIIYLILRYRRKKKMNIKLQYTKLLNQ